MMSIIGRETELARGFRRSMGTHRTRERRLRQFTENQVVPTAQHPIRMFNFGHFAINPHTTAMATRRMKGATKTVLVQVAGAQ